MCSHLSTPSNQARPQADLRLDLIMCWVGQCGCSLMGLWPKGHREVGKKYTVYPSSNWVHATSDSEIRSKAGTAFRSDDTGFHKQTNSSLKPMSPTKAQRLSPLNRVVCTFQLQHCVAPDDPYRCLIFQLSCMVGPVSVNTLSPLRFVHTIKWVNALRSSAQTLWNWGWMNSDWAEWMPNSAAKQIEKQWPNSWQQINTPWIYIDP